jgi:serine/threonine-protein kinase RsbW
LIPGEKARQISIRQTYSSKLENVDAFCMDVTMAMMDNGLTNDLFAVVLLAREAMTNAIIHGNDSDKDKKVYTMFRILDDLAIIRITDEGPGFDWATVKACTPDPLKISGRGLMIYSLYASRLSFNRRGNSIILSRKMSGREKDVRTRDYET